ncbi:MAG: EAL domain-containing protein [Rhizobacter sp.]|nr:EAL domain-containing protein [Rhizobacter sp.]
MQSAATLARTAPLAVWRTLIEAMLHAVWLVDARELRIVAANRAAGALMGRPADELLGKEVIALVATPEDLCFWGEVAAELTDAIESETLVCQADGAVVPVLRRVSRVEGEDGTAMYVVALHDRSEQVRTQRALESAAADLRATLESTQDGILVTDLSGRIRNVNRRFAHLWGVPEELLARHDDDAVLEWMRRSVADPGGYMRRLAVIDDATMLQTTDTLTLHSGKVFERVTMPQCTGGRPIGRIFSFRDITEKVEANQRIQTLSYSDLLTGLPNRRLLEDRFEVALALARREGTHFALLFLNLDHFKHVNETLGRDFGDRVLVDVAERIKRCVRQVDTVARLCGDEFVVLAHQADHAGAEMAVGRILDALKQPFVQGGMSFTVTASVGLAQYPNDGASLVELVRRADAAMREVKQSGRAGFRFHQPQPAGVAAQARSRMRLDHAMRQALAQGRFRLHYQPQVDLQTGRVLGAEALIRWRDAELGEISPGEFIPVAEETGFIVAIDRWVMREAAQQAVAWRAAGLGLVMSVNVSALQFRQPGFVDGVADALRHAGLPADGLELELTESILIQDAEEAMQRLQALAQLGVRLAIDDFGIGYSSLAYLKRFPIGRLKIDRSFISGLPREASDAAIVRAIVSMGRAMNLQIVAEGVETEAQRAFLEGAGCDIYQGYLFAPALDVPAFEARLGVSA